MPIIACISRLVGHKGFSTWSLHALHEIMAMNVQMVVLGTGDWQYEAAFREAAGPVSRPLFRPDHLFRASVHRHLRRRATCS